MTMKRNAQGLPILSPGPKIKVTPSDLKNPAVAIFLSMAPRPGDAPFAALDRLEALLGTDD